MIGGGPSATTCTPTGAASLKKENSLVAASEIVVHAIASEHVFKKAAMTGGFATSAAG